ncbi:MAG: hypothetical protein LBK44_06295 [Spirochaetales bacterium]|nr:hypothetical protein [Spirochaetales bacterium]
MQDVFRHTLYIFDIKKDILSKSDIGFILGASPRCGDRAFRSKSSELPMQFLWAFRCNPLRELKRRTAILRMQIRDQPLARA